MIKSYIGGENGISTGVFMFPNKRAAEIAVGTVRKYKEEKNSGIKVIFNVFKDEDEAWHQAENRFSDFLQSMIEAAKDGKKIVLLELGVGFNTPTIIRFPFEKLMREYGSMIRLNLNEAVVPLSFGNRIVGSNEEMDKSIYDIMFNRKIII